MQTTVAHIVVERLNEDEKLFSYPEDVSGDLMKEHNWLISKDGFDILSRFPTLFQNVCNEVDHAISEGVATFDGETGIVTINAGFIR